jgi:hypothetical protein
MRDLACERSEPLPNSLPHTLVHLSAVEDSDDEHLILFYTVHNAIGSNAEFSVVREVPAECFPNEERSISELFLNELLNLFSISLRNTAYVLLHCTVVD